jgi:hypothetical protein
MRTFDGKTYYLQETFETERDAQFYASRLRDTKDCLTKVVISKESTGIFYQVWATLPITPWD